MLRPRLRHESPRHFPLNGRDDPGDRLGLFERPCQDLRGDVVRKVRHEHGGRRKARAGQPGRKRLVEGVAELDPDTPVNGKLRGEGFGPQGVDLDGKQPPGPLEKGPCQGPIPGADLEHRVGR